MKCRSIFQRIKRVVLSSNQHVSYFNAFELYQSTLNYRLFCTNQSNVSLSSISNKTRNISDMLSKSHRIETDYDYNKLLKRLKDYSNDKQVHKFIKTLELLARSKHPKNKDISSILPILEAFLVNCKLSSVKAIELLSLLPMFLNPRDQNCRLLTDYLISQVFFDKHINIVELNMFLGALTKLEYTIHDVHPDDLKSFLVFVYNKLDHSLQDHRLSQRLKSSQSVDETADSPQIFQEYHRRRRISSREYSNILHSLGKLEVSYVMLTIPCQQLIEVAFRELSNEMSPVQLAMIIYA